MIKSIPYFWPATQGVANTFLKNDGAGNLSWDAGTIGTTPSTPVLISPPNGATGDFRATTFIWNSASPCIVLYHIQIARDAAFSIIVIDQSGITDTTFAVNFCDTIPATFYWRVNAKICVTTPFSSVFSFTNDSVCFKSSAPTPSRSPSDSRLKTNIAPVTNGLDKVAGTK